MKTKSKKEFKNRINFKQITKHFLLGLFAYDIFIIGFVIGRDIRQWNYDDIVLLLLPVTGFLVLLIYLYNLDEKRERDNEELKRELDRMKDIQDTRKKAEEYF